MYVRLFILLVRLLIISRLLVVKSLGELKVTHGFSTMEGIGARNP